MNALLSRVDTLDHHPPTDVFDVGAHTPASSPSAPIDALTLRLGLWLVKRASRPRRRAFDPRRADAVRREHDLTVLRTQVRQIRLF